MNCFHISVALDDFVLKHLNNQQSMFAFLTAEIPVYSLGSFEICNQITSEFSVSSRNCDYAPPKRRSNDTLTRKPQKVRLLHSVSSPLSICFRDLL